MSKIPPMDGTVNHAPQVVLLGAGASIASYYHWGQTGKPLPSMQGLIETLGLKDDIENSGFKTVGLNFEAFYDDLSSAGTHEQLRQTIETKVYQYFRQLQLPDKPTIYDYLISSMREKDIIATFNWDPFLVQAYLRSEKVLGKRRPKIAFLHGNVSTAMCEQDRVVGLTGSKCSKCALPLKPSKLLYPVKHKDYVSDPLIKNEWDTLREYLKNGYFLTVFGYSAPKTDIEARNLILNDWKSNPTLELAEVEIVDIRPKKEILETWEEFFFNHHFVTTDNIFNSYLFTHPRRSCDAFSSATLMCKPWYENPFPQFDTLKELHDWIAPLIKEEEQYDMDRTKFSGDPLAPNEK
jgi:hypothetical protein